MKRMFKHESGRSVLETLAVLAIIAVLTLCGLAGFSYLVQYQRRQESAKEIAELVLNVKTSGAVRKYAAGDVIPAKGLVKGPQMLGNAIKLPDGEDSYALITAMNGGAFAVTLQVQPGTCSAVLDALNAQSTTGVTMFGVAEGNRLGVDGLERKGEQFVNGTYSGFDFDPNDLTKGGGVRLNVNLDETRDGEDKKEMARNKRAAMIAQCEETGMAALVVDCPGGSSSYGHSYGTHCSECPVGQHEDPNGSCCDENAEQRCGEYCSCPDDKMCDNGECVTCSVTGPEGQLGGDKHCWNLYSGRTDEEKFAHHVCEGETHLCVECLEDLDCHSSVGPGNPNPNAIYCVGKTCIECTQNYEKGPDGHVLEGACPTTAKPLCNRGKCEPCGEGMRYDLDEKKCVCVNGVEHPQTHRCVVCYDDKTGTETDSGCEGDASKPICGKVEENGTLPTYFGVGGSMREGTACYECAVNDNCGEGKYCDPATHTCKGCDDGMIWDGSSCRKCRDDRSGEAGDQGCDGSNDGKDLCKPDAGDGTNGTMRYGDECYLCQNNNHGNNEGQRDYGCGTEGKNLCGAGADDYGNTCHKCHDDHENSGTKNELDSGCSDATPICKVDGTFSRTATGKFANSCVKCVNDETDSSKVDAGCTSAKPVCNGEAGGSGTECFECWVDSDCPSDKPVCNSSHVCEACPSGTLYRNGKCAVCFDTATGGTTDTGCGSGTWANKPICGARGWVNNGQGTDGDHCAKCMNDKTGDAQDSGCPTSEPICNAPQGQFGNECEKPCSGNDKCVDSTGACINVSTYDDIERGSDGKCACLKAVKTQTISDMGNSYRGGRDLEDGKACKRLITNRKRLYEIPVNFYCERYMHVSDGAEADDYVASSSPAGISSGGADGTHNCWRQSGDNSIATKVSSSKIKNGTANLVVSDRWAAEVGLNGYFYFTRNKGDNASGAQQKLTVTAKWNPGSSRDQDTGNYRCKSGEGSSRLSGDHHCSRYCGGDACD